MLNSEEDGINRLTLLKFWSQPQTPQSFTGQEVTCVVVRFLATVDLVNYRLVVMVVRVMKEVAFFTKREIVQSVAVRRDPDKIVLVAVDSSHSKAPLQPGAIRLDWTSLL